MSLGLCLMSILCHVTRVVSDITIYCVMSLGLCLVSPGLCLMSLHVLCHVTRVMSDVTTCIVSCH